MNRYGYKQLSDSTLLALPKKEIIKLLRVAEHNYFVTDEAFDNATDAFKECAKPIKYAHWIKNSNFLLMCSGCHEFTSYNTNYCAHCGAKMEE